MKLDETERFMKFSELSSFPINFFLSIWHAYFPFPVFGNNMVSFAIKKNDSFCVQHLVSLRCVYFSNGTVVWNFVTYDTK